jgi:hypothetical protein
MKYFFSTAPVRSPRPSASKQFEERFAFNRSDSLPPHPCSPKASNPSSPSSSCSSFPQPSSPSSSSSSFPHPSSFLTFLTLPRPSRHPRTRSADCVEVLFFTILSDLKKVTCNYKSLKDPIIPIETFAATDIQHNIKGTFSRNTS